jgi:hypothetical protein
MMNLFGGVEMVTFDTVRTLALALPEAEEGPSYGTPGFRVRGKLFARLREDGELLVVRIGRGEREALIAEEPLVFLVTPHYENSPFILVRLATVAPDHLQELLIEAWRLAAPKRLVPAYDAEQNRTVS